MNRIGGAVKRFVMRHQVALLTISGGFTILSTAAQQLIKVLPPKVSAIGTVIGLLGVAASLVSKGHDWLAQYQAGRMKDQMDAANTPDALSLVRRSIQNSVQSIVDSRLETPLGQRLPLALVTRPGAVDDPLQAVATQPGADQKIPAGTPIADVFEKSLRQMLILGPGGAGKSGLLLELAGKLLETSKQDPQAPVPVVLPLASWPNTMASIDDWLVAEVHRVYGVAGWLVLEWLNKGQLIPLLDGLDSVGDKAAAECVDAINEFIGQHNAPPMVVASRLEEYQALGKKLRLHGAVVVQPLTRAEILDCVAGQELAGVRQELEQDQGLVDLMSTPWFLGIVVQTYRGKAVPTGGAPGEQRDHILADYVSACLTQQRQPAEARFTPDLSLRWLGWLARQMQAGNQEVFFYDLMQPKLLSSARRQTLATVGVGVSVGVLIGVFAWISYMSVFGDFAVFLALIGGIVVGLAAYEPQISPTAPLQWSWPQLRRSLPGWLGFGPLFGLLAGLSVGAIAQLGGATVAWFGFIVSGAIAGLSLAIFFALVGALQNQLYVEPKGPGAAIASTLKNALRGGLMMLLLSAVIAGIGGGLIVGLAVLPQGPRGDLAYWLVPGLMVQALAIGLLLGAGGIDPGVRIGLTRSWRTGVVIALGVGIVDAQVAVFMSGHFGSFARFIGSGSGGFVSRGVVAGALLAVMVGIGTGICHGTLRGGGTYLRHKALLSLLRRSGDIPPNYLGFLAYASRVRLLQRRGGGYQFLHRFLLVHLAGGGLTTAPGPTAAVTSPVVVQVGH